jgi:hypothetical protein
MSKNKATRQKHLSYVTQAQLITKAPENHKQDDVSGEFQMGKRGASSFVEGTATMKAKKRRRAQFGFLRSLNGS